MSTAVYLTEQGELNGGYSANWSTLLNSGLKSHGLEGRERVSLGRKGSGKEAESKGESEVNMI